MSYDVAFVVGEVEGLDLPLSRLRQVLELTGSLNPRIRAFCDRIEVKRPHYDLRPAEEIIAAGWTESPVLCEFGREHVTIAVMQTAEERVIPELVTLAHDMGLLAFDFEAMEFLHGEGFECIMHVEDRRTLIGPRLREVRAAVADMTPDGGPSFLILTKPNIDYAQIAGGDGAFVFEWREHRGETFSHWAAGHLDEDSRGSASVQTNGYHVRVNSNERLSQDDVMELFETFLRDERRPDSYAWRDMTGEFHSEPDQAA